MGLFSGLFGSEETSTELPDWVVGPATEMLQRSVDMGKAGFMPWTGPSVAAIDRSQVAGMQNNQDMAAAFGMQTAMPNIMPATDFGGGVFGHSAMPLYDQNMANLQQRAPGQMDYYRSFFVDPVTGVEGTRMQQSNLQTLMEQANGGRTSEAEDARNQGFIDGATGWNNGVYDRGDGSNGNTGGGGGFLGGYNGIGDMFDGGGPGQSGSSFGGAFGGVSNAAGLSPSSGGGLFGGLFG